MSISPEQAIRTYPELGRLAELRRSGWSFLPLQPDDAGVDPTGIVGYRGRGEFVDVLYIYGRGETRAVRLLGDTPSGPGGVVWERSGSLADTVEALLALPLPGEPGAPRLVIGRWSVN